jgi:hypothetical protein
MAKARARWHAPIGDRRTKDQRTPAEPDHNRLQAGLRALVEQAIGHLANAWTLRRWRGLLYRVRDVFRAATALICLGRWIHRIPTGKKHPDTLTDQLVDNAVSRVGPTATVTVVTGRSRSWRWPRRRWPAAWPARMRWTCPPRRWWPRRC